MAPNPPSPSAVRILGRLFRVLEEAVGPWSFEAAYAVLAPWDIGRPQPDVVALAYEGGFVGRVLDVGCGTGEHARFLAGRGHDVVGVDLSRIALRRARRKARLADVDHHVSFERRDALALQGLGSFDTALDVGLFHNLAPRERPRYAASLASVLAPGGAVHILGFSDAEPAGWGGPHRLPREAFAGAFQAGWTVEAVRRARFHTRFHVDGGEAWLATVRRTAEPSEATGHLAHEAPEPS